MTEKLRIVVQFLWLRWGLHFRSRKQLEAYQLKMLQKQFHFLRKESTFFKNLPNLQSIDELKSITPMNKQVMMGNFDAMNTVGVHVQDALVEAIREERSRDFTPTHRGLSFGLSSGTSGHRGLFVVSRAERRLWAAGVLAKFLPKGRLSGHRIAFFLRANNNLYEAVGSRLIKFKYFDVYKDMDVHITCLRAYQPTILVAPPSVLSVLADAIENKTLELKLQKVISVAEVLTLTDEQRFKRVFGMQNIHQAYQCTEGFLAYTCEAGTLHLNEDTVCIEKEWLDDNRYIPIVTDFRRKSQPIIRYRLNDVLRQRLDPCSCKSVFSMIEAIEGREDDIFYFDTHKGTTIPVYADMIGRCMLYVKGLAEYKVVQRAPQRVMVYLAHDTSSIRSQIKKEFQQLSKNLGCVTPQFQFAPYTRDFTKKLKRIERVFEI